MTGPDDHVPAQDPYGQPVQYGHPAPYGAPYQQGWPVAPYAGAPVGAYGGARPVGKVRGTGTCILLAVVTLGIYSLYWYFSTHEEMKRHSGTGLGGGVALLLAFFVGIAMPYITSSEVGGLYERRGQAPPVTGVTGLWSFPGVFLFLVGPVVWFVKTNGALNAYWRSVGAVG